MKTDGEPESARSTQSQTGEHREQKNLRSPDQILAGVCQVHSGKDEGPDNRGRPKSNGFRQCELHIAAIKEFFYKSHQQKANGPQDCVLQKCEPVKCQASERK